MNHEIVSFYESNRMVILYIAFVIYVVFGELIRQIATGIWQGLFKKEKK